MSNDPLDSAAFQQANPIFGTPEHDSVKFPGKQSYPDTCAIRCEEFILRLFTGKDYDEKALIRESMNHNWYSPGNGGIEPKYIGKLLELHGINVNRYENASILHLGNELAQGHKVIIGVHAQDLQNQNHPLNILTDFFTSSEHKADHAVVVSGINTSNPEDIRVTLSDPNTGKADASYPLDQFLTAWRDSNFFVVSTQQPAPPWLPEMANFDDAQNHISHLLEKSYESLESTYQEQVLPYESWTANNQTESYANENWKAGTVWDNTGLDVFTNVLQDSSSRSDLFDYTFNQPSILEAYHSNNTEQVTPESMRQDSLHTASKEDIHSIGTELPDYNSSHNELYQLNNSDLHIEDSNHIIGSNISDIEDFDHY